MQEMPLDSLTLVASGAWAPWDYNNWRLKHTPSLSVKENYYLVLELWPEGVSFSFGTHLWTYQAAFFF